MCCYTDYKIKCCPITALHDFVHDFIRKLMFCSTNVVTKLNLILCAFRKCCPVCQIFLSTYMLPVYIPRSEK